jgi:hypothetical protein
MADFDPLLILASLVGIAGAVYMSKKGYSQKGAEGFASGLGFLGAGKGAALSDSLLGKPVLWLVIDDYGTNSRKWADFGSRNSSKLNIGFVNITKTRCAITQGGAFEIRELFGRAAVADAIYAGHGYVPSGHFTAPRKLWQAWARAALLSVRGGLYLDGMSLCLGPSFDTIIANKPAAVFGTDMSEKHASGVAGPYAGWSASAGHKAWTDMAVACAGLIDAGTTSWSAAVARNQMAAWYNTILAPNMPTIRDVEYSRRNDGLPIEIEDMLGRSASDTWKPSKDVIYVPMDFEKLDRSVTYKWFMRMSSEQIMEPDSDFIWAHLAKGAGSRDNLFTW